MAVCVAVCVAVSVVVVEFVWVDGVVLVAVEVALKVCVAVCVAVDVVLKVCVDDVAVVVGVSIEMGLFSEPTSVSSVLKLWRSHDVKKSKISKARCFMILKCSTTLNY